MMYTSGNTFFSVLALHLSNDAGLKIFYIYHYVGGRKRCALCDAQIDGKVHCHCILEHTYDDVPCKSYNVYIFTRKVRVSRLTKNPNGHLFHIHVNFFFFVFFLDRFLQSSHLQNYNFRDTLERFFQCYVMDKISCRSIPICSQLSMTFFFWKIVSYNKIIKERQYKLLSFFFI